MMVDMPIDLTFDEPAVVKVTASGVVTFADIALALDELLADARIVPGMSMLSDARGVTSLPSTAELRLIARDLKPLRDRGITRIAIYTDSTFVYGVVRMFGVFAEAVNLKIGAFRHAADAEQWLGAFHKAA